MTWISDLQDPGGTEAEIPEPIGFRWYLRSPLPVYWLAKDVMPALAYLRERARMPVVNLSRGWLHGTYLEVIAHSDDGRAVPWPQVIVRLREPGEETSAAYAEEGYLTQARELGQLERVPGPYLPYRSHGTFEWLSQSDLQPWPGRVQALREQTLTRMLDSLAVTLAPGGGTSACAAAPPAVVAEVMLATADAHPLHIPRSAFCYRAQAEAFLRQSPDAENQVPDFRRRLAGDAPALRPLVERMLGGGDTKNSASWRRTAAYCMGLFDGAMLAGDLTPQTLNEISDRRGGGLPPGADDEGPGCFASYRLLLSLQYAQLPLLGVSPGQYYYLCWAIAETVDEVTGGPGRSAIA